MAPRSEPTETESADATLDPEPLPRRPVIESLDQVDWDGLSHESKWAAKCIVQRLILGFSRSEIAQIYGVRPGEISAMLAQLRAEIRAQLDGKPRPVPRVRI